MHPAIDQGSVHHPLRTAWPVALLIAVATTACTVAAAPTPRAESAPASPAGSGSSSPSPPASASEPPEPDPSEPIPTPGTHVAAGLALVRFAVGGPESQVFVVDPDGELRQVTGFGPVSAVGASLPAWSPDGRLLAFGPPKVGAGPQRFLSVVGAGGADERAIAPLGDEFGLPFGWSPDGRLLLFFDIDAVDGAAIWLADVTTGEVRHLVAGHGPRWLPDGDRISFVLGVEGRDPADPEALTQAVHILDLADGTLAEFAVAADAVWSPEGSAVVLQEESGDLVLADSDGSRPRYLARGWAPAWSPDGALMVIQHGHDADGTPLLALVDLDGRFLWSGVRGAAPSWSPDGTRIAVEVVYPESIVRVLDASTGGELWRTDGAQPAWGSWPGE